MTERPPKLVDHFFRHEYGRLVALIDQAVRAAASRPGRGHGAVRPGRRPAHVANAAACPTSRPPGSIASPATACSTPFATPHVGRATGSRPGRRARPAARRSCDSRDDAVLDSEIEDSQLRLMFACGHPVLPAESRIALTLKTLCGFSTAEIARGLLDQRGERQEADHPRQAAARRPKASRLKCRPPTSSPSGSRRSTPCST